MARWIDLGPPEDFPAGSRRTVKLEGRPVCVFNVAGQLLAFTDVCPHAGMPLGEGQLSGKVITCPFHGYAFNLETGKNIDYADDVPLMTHPIRVEAGKVQVELPSQP